MYNRRALEEVQPPDVYDDNRPAIWPDVPSGDVDFVLVGEAPGKQEVKQGRVFIGPAGERLRDWLKDAGITRFHLTNASLFRPTTGSEDKPPKASVIKAERPRLHLEVSMLKPKAIVAMGATAAYALLGEQPRMRGMVRYLTIHGREYPVYVTWHPAAVLRNHDYYRDVAEDLDRASKLALPLRAKAPQWSNLSAMREAAMIAVDTEATSPHSGTAELLMITVSDGEKVAEVVPAELAKFLVRYKGRVVGHNAPGDEVLLRRNAVPIRFTDDTLLKHLSQDERKGSHKLKALAPAIAGFDTGVEWIWAHTHAEGDTDDERTAFKDIPRTVLLDYCGLDSMATAVLDNALDRESDERSRRVYGLLQRAYRAFTEGMMHGVTINTELLAAKTIEQEALVGRLRQSFGFNPESNPQTVAAFQSAGYKIKSVARPVISKLAGDLPRLYSEYRDEYKILSAFLRPLGTWRSPEDGRVRPTYKIHGTATGRTSCGDPNLQQVPPELRDLFVAAEGNTFVGWDYKVHEVRGIGYYSRDRRLLEVLRDRAADPHQLIADTVGLPRQTSKHSLFGVAYGASEAKLVKQHGISPAEAAKAYREIKKFLPDLDAWKESVYTQVYDKGFVETPYGRRRNFPYMDERNRHRIERQAVNALVQSLCGDVAMESAIAVYEQTGYAPLIFVHDFNLIEVRLSDAQRVAKECERIASSIFPNEFVEWVPEIKIGRTWGELQPYQVEEQEDEE